MRLILCLYGNQTMRKQAVIASCVWHTLVSCNVAHQAVAGHLHSQELGHESWHPCPDTREGTTPLSYTIGLTNTWLYHCILQQAMEELLLRLYTTLLARTSPQVRCSEPTAHLSLWAHCYSLVCIQASNMEGGSVTSLGGPPQLEDAIKFCQAKQKGTCN